MRTLLYPEFDRLEIADRPRPEPTSGEVLLRVAACGICGSELEAFKSRSPRRIPPLVLGHEFCGVVDEVGPGVNSLARGQQVVSHSLFGCGACVRCKRGDSHLCGTRQLFGMTRQGGFAEYVTVPEKCVVAWPDQLTGSVASLAEPLANGVHVVGLSRSVNPAVVAIIGAGPIGLMCQQAFRSMTSADVLVADLAPKRLEAAKRLGATEVINPPAEDFVSRVLALTGGDGADVVVDAVGSGTSKQQSLRATRAGGISVWIGLHENTITLDSFDITLPERRIQGSYAATLEELKVAVDLLAGGRVDGTSWVKTFPLHEGVEAFGRMLAAKDDDIKAVLVP